MKFVLERLCSLHRRTVNMGTHQQVTQVSQQEECQQEGLAGQATAEHQEAKEEQYGGCQSG